MILGNTFLDLGIPPWGGTHSRTASYEIKKLVIIILAGLSLLLYMGCDNKGDMQWTRNNGFWEHY